ncbi:hypothetical protein VTK26DRAFT_1807 [Humicola hyalothermophila]
MGLVQYDSSDEEEDVQTPVEPQPSNPPVKSSTEATQQAHGPAPTPSAQPPPPPETSSLPPTTTPSQGPVLGPALGPSRPPPNFRSQSSLPEVDLSFLTSSPPPADQDPADHPPRSPYTATRALLRDLTLPSHANMDIPPSPPGSPPPGHDALTAKFDHFLALKRKPPGGGGGGGGGGVGGAMHFNARLAESAGMRNPSLMDKLLGFVGVETDFHFPAAAGDEGGGGGGGGGIKATEQYATVLPTAVWDPHCFPPQAYRGELRKAQERMAKERERGRGEPVEFVPAGTAPVGIGGGRGMSEPGSATASRSATPGVGGPKGKGRFDT